MPRIYNVKNLSSAVAVVVFSTSLLACGGGGGSDGGSDSQSSNNPKPTPPKPSDKCKNATANISGQSDLDKDGTIDDCDSDIDGDGIVNAKDARPLDINIASTSTKSYKGDGFGYINATENFYFNAKNQLVEQEYLSSSNPDRANSSKQFTYDDKDRLIRREQTRGLDKRNDGVEVWVYNQKGQLTEFNTNSDGDSVFESTVIYQYNSDGNIEQIVERDPSDTSYFSNATNTYTYNDQNQLEKIETDEYNDGSIDRIKNITFNANNYVAKSALYYIKVDDITNSEVKELYETSEYSYDNQGNVLKDVLTYERGGERSTTYSYNSQKNITKKITVDGPSVIDVEVSYNKDGLANDSMAKYRGFMANVQDVAEKAEYNNAGYLVKTLVDVSQNGRINQEITYSYKGSVPLKFNVPIFVNFGLSNDRAPTATSILNKVNTRYTADMVKESYFQYSNV
ncbi:MULTISPECIES: hypothetical protein [unclassified Psychrobacter]|uniref:hypothetical protein n=1 Tax=unclassified Psychrobacter TaxID=196806 RepID=UPI0004006AE7|nr:MULTISPECIES: hypothetical protein [unclassified Psychrobacter]